MHRSLVLLSAAAYAHAQCDGLASGPCASNAACIWDAPWKPGTCQPDPCTGKGTVAVCEAVEVPVTPCPSPVPDPDYCQFSPCKWNGRCERRHCLHKDEASCKGEKECAWRPPAGGVPAGPVQAVVDVCHQELCAHLDMFKCFNTAGCTHDFTHGCHMTGCGEHDNEATCDQDSKCKWDNAAAGLKCGDHPCAKKSKNTCTKDTTCMWKSSKCVSKTCAKYNDPNDKCACEADKSCKWHHDATHPHCVDPKFNECPDLDIAMVLDGSGSMSRSFGQHPHGFYAMMEIMRAWIRTLPLTGDDHTKGANAAKGTGEFRVTFIQFSKANALPSEDHPTGCGVGQCTEGLLSGRLDELEGDVTWHENNYQAHWTYIHKALQDVADHAFLPTQSPTWRQHVVVIVADGGLTDFDGDACCDDRIGCGNPRCVDRRTFDPSFPGLLNKAQADLRGEKVTVYGVVIRRSVGHNALDESAAAKLKTIISDPRDEHFINIMLDELPDKVLNTLCDPNSKFGKGLNKPGKPTGCSSKTNEPTCEANEACAWDAAQNPKCHDDPCFPLCNEETCKRDARCQWTNKVCKLKPPACSSFKTAAACTGAGHLWQPIWSATKGCECDPCKDHTSQLDCTTQSVTMPAPCTPPFGKPDYCKLPVCKFDKKTNKCSKKDCLKTSETECKKETGCVWTPVTPTPDKPTVIVGQCDKPICDATDANNCGKDPRCLWNACSSKCTTQVCYSAHLTDKTACDKDLRCQWRAGTPQGACSNIDCMNFMTKSPCNCEQDPKCMPTGKDSCLPATPVPPTPVPPTNAPPTNAPPTNAPPTNAPPTASPPTNAPPTNAPPTNAPPTNAPPTDVPPTNAPPTPEPIPETPVPVPTPKPEVDECSDKAKAQVCEKAGQVCQDPDTKLDGNFICKCQPPATATNAGAAVKECPYDECKEHETTCTAQGQTCKDTDKLKMQTWVCECIPPQSPDPAGSVGQQKPAVCKDPPGDCEKHGKICTAAGQHCKDGTARDDKVTCECLPPATVAPGTTPKPNTPAVCKLDECVVTCPHCAQTKADPKNVCTEAGQTCEDGNTDPQSTGDWKCICKAPAKGSKLIAAADCELDECTVTCPTCANTGAGNKCQLAGQTCVDPKKTVTSTGDWECKCISPATGSAVAKPVDKCTEDECKTQEKVCVKAGQTCADPDKTKKGDWTCVCPPPSTTVGQQAAAVCEADECKNGDEPQKTCEAAGQECVDKDKTALNNWECVCKAPGTGVKVLGPVDHCELDECAVKCPTCANANGKGNVCELNGQTCEDPKTTTSSLSDWRCKCPPPSTATALTAPVASCEVKKDECVEGPSTAIKECEHVPRYTDGGCLCKCNWESQFTCSGAACKGLDPKGPGTVGHPCKAGCCNPDGEPSDWCYVDKNEKYNQDKPACMKLRYGFCTAAGLKPQDGGKKLRAPLPGVPAGQNNVCTDAGQKCIDPDMTKDGDWVCECVLPLTGPLGPQKPTTCDEDECKTHAVTCGDQLCEDTDKSKNGTWVCKCPPPSQPNPKQGGRTTCELNECAVKCPTCAVEKPGSANVCAAVGQKCEDPNNSTTSLSDWRCVCPPPSTGSAVGATANCTLDECEVVCPTCADKGSGQNLCRANNQICHDPNPTAGSVGDWTCTCKAPFTDKQVASLALCQVDECEDNAKKCAAGQQCIDPSQKKMGDWYCECLPPATGIKVGGSAECKTDECKDKAKTCTDKGQHCVDPNLAVTGDWICECIAPDLGAPGQQKPSTDCTPPDACKTKADVCTSGGQHCTKGLKAGDFQCECIAPATGTPGTNGKAVCETDECVAICATCQQTTPTAHPVCEIQGQQCVDPDKTKPSNWECRCAPPTTGTAAVMKPAACELDECKATCKTCAGTTCKDKGQKCEEGVKTLRHLSDWHCVCPPPSTNKARAAAAVSCTYDECSDAATKKVCEDADQVCVDPDTKTQQNWECHCKAPASGSKTKGPADGCDVVNECTMVCPTCANTGSGNACQGAGQKCVDPSHTTTGDWYCECKVGHGIAVGSVVPRCVLDECKDKCPTCATQGANATKNMCELEGQTCEDPVQDTLAVGDWRCVCPPPLQHIKQMAKLATCGVDECKERVNGTVPGSVCTQAGQLCSDPKPDTLGDFVCSCPPPSSGVHTGGPVALCTVDECKLHGKVCTNATQTCLDPDVKKLNDWVCECPPPSSTVQVRGVAKCEVDECRTKADLCSPMQDCVDPDKTVGGDVECRCRAPATGSAKNGPASCKLDECVADCATCSKRKCEAAGQTCEDPNPTLAGLGDWKCKCAPPSIAYAVANAAVCPVDECVEHGHVCLKAGQKCVDPNHSASSTGDWECQCTAPLTGVALGKPATCEHDECTEHGHVCTDKGQTCFDPTKTVAGTGDWECRCLPPAKQTAVAKPAECKLVGECEDPTINKVCTSVGQHCVDPSKTTMNDWMCECVAPSTGPTKLRGPTVCKLDECKADCGTCAHGACAKANQQCVDTNLDPVKGLRTWECRCVAPKSGSKALAPATCTVDECVQNGPTCTTAGQDCEDPDTSALGDWVCKCRKPSVGQATATAADCVTDECEANGKKCVDAGQTCFDVNKAAASTGDWECRCADPATGSAVAKPVEKCLTDECKLHGKVCTNAGQTCVDDEKEIDGFWFCVCADGKTRGDGKAATCKVDECVTVGNTTAVPVAGQPNVCAQKKQTCMDPNTAPGSLKDWTCTCPAPNAGKSAVAAVANCDVDECKTKADVCTAGQECVDPDWKSTGDWECRCTPPATGKGVGKKAPECLVDECFANAKVCKDAVQVCEDTDKTKLNTWVCKCPPHAAVTNSTLMAPTSCTPPAKSECLIPAIEKICKDKGQLCVDPNTSTKNDWTCECVAPAKGAAVKGAPATCVLDECKEDCNTCAHTTCAAAGQKCVDPNTDATSVKDWECRCVAPRSGKGVATVAVCQLDECKTVCTSCADHGAGNACLLHDQTCVDPNTDARSTSDWVCVCKPANLGNATVGIARCVVDECEKYGPLVCKGDQTCNDPNTAPDSLGDWTCTCPPPAEGSGTAMRAHCTLNECHNQDNHMKCEEAGQICIDPKPLPGSLKDWECHCPQGAIAAVMKPAECTLNECTETCKTCANKGGGNVCEKAGQTCFDPKTSTDSTGDWTCTCAAGAPAAVGNVAVCPLDECTMPGNFAAVTCTEVPRTTAEGCECECNWKATSGLDASATGPGATEPCKAGCCNPDQRAGGDWCIVKDTAANKAKGCLANTPKTCVGPSPKSATNVCTKTAPGAPKQRCVDADTSSGSQGDWKCECVAPATGAAVKVGLATCVVDECKTKFDVCEQAGQVCKDTSAAEGDWQCECPPPATGSKKGGVATCKYVGECDSEAVSKVCTQVGQTCVDPDAKKAGDWVCQCVAPAKGVSVKGAPAVCILDECTAKCATCADTGSGDVCAAAGQKCEEGSKSPDTLRDWKCVCPEGQTGAGQAAPAVCLIDECALNNGQHKDMCGAAGQTCKDPNTNATGGLGDWQCVCPPPGEGKATGKLADCAVDECQVTAHRDVCTHAGQTCVDPNTNSGALGNWECRCIGKALSAVAKPADCHVPPASWCGVNGKTCTAVGQRCIAGTPLSAVGQCGCIEPQTGANKTGAPATCELDECAATCPTCADSGAGNVCTANGQRCVEGSKHPETGLHDWQCVCANSGVAAVAAPAKCSVNECSLKANKQVCLGAEQVCVDPDTAEDSTGDWYCECHKPWVGKKVAGAAECTYDECMVHAATCQAHGQTCMDPNVAASSSGDWKCVCVAPATGSAVAKAATCVYTGECADAAKEKICEDAGQTCVDPDTAKAGDWECRCVAPQTGEAGKQAAAKCILDECKMSCPTCAVKPGSQTHACAAMEQTCVDLDTNVHSTGNWKCMCVAPKSGEQVGAAAACAVDECKNEKNKKVCETMKDAAGKPVQLCQDPDKTKSGDWTCVCQTPYVGTPAVHEAAVCKLDECSLKAAWAPNGKNGNSVCEAAGQVCVDPQQDALARDNWLCKCADGGDHVALKKPVAAGLCKPKVGLCAQHANACPTGQQCAEIAGKWYCECIAPAVGRKEAAGANCTLDECTARCSTCAQQGSVHTCAVAGQSCIDENTSADSLNDWSCVCQTGDGRAKGKAAECVVDECKLNGGVCTAAGQTCSDPDKAASSTGNWMCHCKKPSTGSATAGAAECRHDECLEKAKTCTDAGQSCLDQNEAEASKGDWVCKCPPPATGGSMVAGPATCKYTGGCDDAANRKVCAAQGQKCVSGAGTNATGAWSCACIAPSVGPMGAAKPAVCELDECLYICPTCARTSEAAAHACTSAGQTCKDPNTSDKSLSDWVCSCPPPSTAAALGKPVEKCEMDECVMVSQHGARKCEHFQRFTVQGCQCACPWRVETNAPGFDGPGFSEDCVQGCCNPNNDAKGDWCMVAATDYNRGIPACLPLIAKVPTTCAAESAARPAKAPPLPVVPGGDAASVPNVCTMAGQICVDKSPTASSLGDWECKCPHSDGKKALAVADCEVDECRQPQWEVTPVPDTPSPDTPAPAVASTPAPPAGPAKDGCGNDQRYTKEGCQCACPWKAVVHGKGAPPMSGPGFDTDCRAGCCNPDKAATKWCMLANSDWNRNKAECKNMIAQKQDCAAGKPAGAPSRSADVLAAAAVIPTKAEICKKAGQVCFDPDTKGSDNWECRCAGSAKGKKVMGPVTTCTYDPQDECKAKATRDVCTKAGQYCFDPDTDKTGDWECRCTAPAVGTPKKGAVATCTLDECVEQCATCADKADGKGHTCRAKGQTCEDPDKSAAATNNWVCTCAAPAKGTATAAAAVCVQDECLDATKAKVCTDAGQKCVDPVKTVDSMNDWECRCTGKGHGKGVAKAAECEVDECLEPGKLGVCAGAGQTCFDPNMGEASLNDYECRCPAPASGKAVAKAAKCTFTGECSDAAKAKVCTDAGQTCVDPDAAVSDDWVCVCVAPKTGLKGKQAAASCGTDECTAHCPTCEEDVCSAKGQLCVDPDVTVTKNWLCRCIAPQTGADKTGAPATCTGLTCAEVTGEDPCTKEPLCMWDKVVGCTDLRTPAPGWYLKCAGRNATECKAEPLCDATKDGKCTNECEQIGTEDPCAKKAGCLWADGGCVRNRDTPAPAWTLECAKQTSEVACTKDPKCAWTADQKCVEGGETPAPGWGMRCEMHPAEPACRESKHCSWNAQEKKCTSVCGDNKAQSPCEATKMCLWQGGVCVPPAYTFQCVKYREEPSCVTDDRCLWDSAEKQCYFKCETKTAKSACEDNAKCLWRPAAGAVPAKCFQRQCAMFEHELPCEGQTECQWTGNKTCVSKCDARDTQSTCETAAGGLKCKWDANRKTTVKCTPVEVPPEHGLCKYYKADEAACNDDIRCKWADSDKCVPIALGGWTPTPTEWGSIRGAPPGEGDDDDCWWCWLLLALLLLCCSCCILAFLLLRRKQKSQATEADDEKWNKQFEAQVDEDVGTDEQSNPRSPHKEGVPESEKSQSLLYGEEMSDKGAEKAADDDI